MRTHPPASLLYGPRTFMTLPSSPILAWLPNDSRVLSTSKTLPLDDGWKRMDPSACSFLAADMQTENFSPLWKTARM